MILVAELPRLWARVLLAACTWQGSRGTYFLGGEMQHKDMLYDVPVLTSTTSLPDLTLSWLTRADPADAATAEVAVLMEACDSLPVVAVRGPVGIGVEEATEALNGTVVGRRECWFVADAGPVGSVPAVAVVRLSHDPAAVAGPSEITVNPCESAYADLHQEISELLGSDAAVTESLELLLRQGLEEVAVSYPSVRDELEELLWPRG